MNKVYIHYGHDAFDSNLFTTPTNRRHANKPKGGLWASATDAPYGWRDWCNAESYCSCDEEDSFCFQITDNANVFTINSVADVNQMPLQKDGWSTHTIKAIDFELMRQNGVDVIEYNLSNGRSEDMMDDLYFALYGWDCDCILVLNPEVIILHNITK
jgi:hypothetical protein